jgi:sulfite reductase alpha subunit-like flavoprotein
MLCAIAAEQGGLDAEGAKNFVAALKKSGRYQADVY